MKHLPAPHPDRGVGPTNWDGHEFSERCPCGPLPRNFVIRNGRTVAARPDERRLQHRELPGQYGRTADEIEAAAAAAQLTPRPDLRRHVKSGARW